MSQHLNVVFIMTDQQRADSIGPDRHPCADYPNMERLRSESVSFDRFFTAASPCVPSRHTFLTGRQPWQLGVNGNGKFSKEGDATWMQALREYGYRCVSVGKTHMIHAGSFHIQIPPGESFGDRADWNHFEPAPTREPEPYFFDIHMTRRACAAIERLNDSKPFAMFIGFHAPHEPYVMPEAYLDYCKLEDVPLPAYRSADEYETKSEAYRKRVDLFRKMHGDITDGMVRKGIAGHHCALKMVDDCLGQLMETLRKQNLLERTLIVYTSDHGELLGEHGLFNKAATSYESEIRIPFMIRFPDGYKAGERVDALASSLDFAPTLFDVLGVSPDLSLPGHSLMPSIAQGKPVREYVTLFGLGGAMGIRTEDRKLWYHPHFKDGELYHLAEDPAELRNLYDDRDAADARRALFELMLHARMMDDLRDSAPTRRDHLLREEIRASCEPQVH
ncbi:N-acetylglucosamine-6-O-sulfatase [Paenibacillus solanacearum]|uniref:N-acetylglucosamine-6-O-sulfatase n=1 Tax=Paenibacillus solanacearum TaxID=2048548 RepID=A0A916NWD0_9BACL|nr:sulfatase-like hydrolase/transferase [Paenibacillus solanacearum]CAG7615969.1 N-acetylglucosamine-6-O-sulfatase [Paenibacillus solanacearum]